MFSSSRLFHLLLHLLFLLLFLYVPFFSFFCYFSFSQIIWVLLLLSSILPTIFSPLSPFSLKSRHQCNPSASSSIFLVANNIMSINNRFLSNISLRDHWVHFWTFRLHSLTVLSSSILFIFHIVSYYFVRSNFDQIKRVIPYLMFYIGHPFLFQSYRTNKIPTHSVLDQMHPMHSQWPKQVPTFSENFWYIMSDTTTLTGIRVYLVNSRLLSNLNEPSVLHYQRSDPVVCYNLQIP